MPEDRDDAPGRGVGGDQGPDLGHVPDRVLEELRIAFVDDLDTPREASETDERRTVVIADTGLPDAVDISGVADASVAPHPNLGLDASGAEQVTSGRRGCVVQFDAVEVRRRRVGLGVVQSRQPIDRREQERGLPARRFEHLAGDAPHGPIGHVPGQRLRCEERAASLAEGCGVERGGGGGHES